MRSLNLLLKVTALLALSLVVAMPSWADKVPVRGGSTYGDNTGLATCEANISDFVNGGSAVNCEGFAPAQFTVGGNTYNGAVFAFLEPGGSAFGVLDILALGGNSSLTLNLVNPALPTGVFMCGSFTFDTVVQDSTPTPMPGLPCTPGSSGGAYSSSQDVNVQANFLLNSVTFVNLNSTGIAVFTAHDNIQGSTATTPEPGSLMLLGVGLLALGRKLRHTR